MGIGFFLGVGAYFSRVSANFVVCVFFVWFLVFFGGVFVLLWCFVLFFARSAKFFLTFFFRGDFFFSRGREQNVKFPLCHIKTQSSKAEQFPSAPAPLTAPAPPPRRIFDVAWRY